MHNGKILPPGWDPKRAGDEVLKRLITVTAPQVKGAHDAEMALMGDFAYIVAEVNDISPGEGVDRPEIYSALSIVNLKTPSLVTVIPFARSEQPFANEILPYGQCFVPRILLKDENTLRCYFASQNPGSFQAQTWYLDFNISRGTFADTIFRAKIKTSAGVFDMQPGHFHADAAARGFTGTARDHGLYIFDSFKLFDGRIYAALNNFPGKQNALAMVNDDLDTFEIVGHYNEPQKLELSESSVNRLPGGSWMAICRQDGGDQNYLFTTSPDGNIWSRGKHREFVPDGTNSKPTFDRFASLYYLGWQEASRINGVKRSVFNLDVSLDAEKWERKYRFESDMSFQYPAFRTNGDSIYLTVTRGEAGCGGKRKIMFGKLENIRAGAHRRQPSL